MNLIRTGAGAALLLALVVGCDDEEVPRIAAGNGTPTPIGDSGVPVATTGPLISVSSPLASTDPIAGPVMVGPSVAVKCVVKQRTGESPVDPTKVNVLVISETGTDPLVTPATLQGPDTYGASVGLAPVPTGRIRIRCEATDTSTVPLMGFGELQTFYDAGPTITFTNLTSDSIVRRGLDVAVDLPVQFKVEPARLSAQDTGADVGEVKLTISDKVQTLDAPVDNAYTKQIDFSELFDNAPIDSVTVAVVATNKRGTGTATASKQLIVKVDGNGPSINVTQPPRVGDQPPIVGGTVPMVMTITDNLSGVAQGDDKVFAQILDKRYPMTAGPNNTYSFTFEASQFSSTADIIAQLHAFDTAGTETITPFPMRLDTVAPYVSLQEPNVRVVEGLPSKCSASFKPLGNSPVDGQVVSSQALFRALVWERGIRDDGQNIVWLSGVQPGSVAFYLQSDATVPLLINQAGNKNGVCDAINNSAMLGSRAPLLQAFSPIAVGGGLPLASLGPNETDFSSSPIVAANTCEPLGGTVPGPKCPGSDMSYVIRHTQEGSVPVLYTSSPTGSGLGCTGATFTLGDKTGWMCVAAVARDQSGNLGLSKPIRVCRTRSSSDCEGKVAGTLSTPPASLTCTDGCALPKVATDSPLSEGLLYY